MMDYKVFKETVTKIFMNYMSEPFKNMELEIHPVNKINETVDGMNLVRKRVVETSPTIYITDMYKHYQETNNLEEVLRMEAEKIEKAMEEATGVVPIADINKDNIVFQLVNTEQNKKMLLDKPSRSFQDLSIIYRWIAKVDEKSIQSIVIDNSLAKKLSLSEEQMFRLAEENTRRVFPPTVRAINDVILGKVADIMTGEIPVEQNMWIISNEMGTNGAISLLYEDILHELAEKLGTDLYIMPSSIHETIAVSVSMHDPNELAKMVAEINMDQVALDERLSNQVYYYDKDLRKLSMATNTPTKRLDGAE